MSIFDDDYPTPPQQKPGQANSHATPQYGEDGSLRDSLFGSSTDNHLGDTAGHQRLEPSFDDYEPLDNNRNRNLSHSLTGVRDEGPAGAPAPKPETVQSEVRNPFMSVTPAPRQPVAPQPPAPPQPPAATEPRATAPAPQPAPARAERSSQAPPTPASRPTRQTPAAPATPVAVNRIGFGQLAVWGLIAMALILGAWNMIYLSETADRVQALSATVDNLNNKVNLIGNDQPAIADAIRPELDNLLSQIDTLAHQLRTLQERQSNAAPQQQTLTELGARLDAVENNLQLAAAAAEALPEQTPQAPAPSATAADWLINIAVLSDQGNAKRLKDKVQNQGADARMESFPSNGRTLYRIRAYGYTSQRSAEQDAQRLQSTLNLSGFWVTKQ